MSTVSKEQYPETAVVWISGAGGTASGVAIDPYDILTASHVVEDLSVAPYHVTPAENLGSAPFGAATVVDSRDNPLAISNSVISFYQIGEDFGLLHLYQPLNGVGSMGLRAGFNGGDVTWSGYPAASEQTLVTTQQTVKEDMGGNYFDGISVGPGSSGSPLYTSDDDVVGIASSGDGIAGYYGQLTQGDVSEIIGWRDEMNAAAGNYVLQVLDTASNEALVPAVKPYAGPVAGLTDEVIFPNDDSLNIKVYRASYIKAGSGNDGIDASGSAEAMVLDGGAGSNFITDGGGPTTNFIDTRNAAPSWDTFVGLKPGDALTMWGLTKDDFLTMTDNQGAAGYKGLTLTATWAGKVAVAITLTGYSSADVSNGRLSISYGSLADSGLSYGCLRPT